MEATNGKVIYIDHVDGSSVNISKDQVNQSNEQNEKNEKINLLEMPREILEHISVHLDDDYLLAASHVCKLLASVAETAFKRKYSNEFYNFDERLKSYEKVMLMKYGGHIRWMNVNRGDEEALDLVEQNCRNLERVELTVVPRMLQVDDLKEFSLMEVYNVSRETFVEFINRNQQLEVLALDDTQLNSIDVLDGWLSCLKKLEYEHYNELTRDLSKIRLNSLEALRLYSFQNGTFVRILPALECKQLKQLELVFYSGPDDNDEVINAIGKFEMLASLRMMHFPITEIQLKKLAANLPHLTELSFRLAEEKCDTTMKVISAVLSIIPKLSKLKIHLNENVVFDEFVSDAENFINEFYTRFADTNTQIEVAVNYHDSVHISTNFVCVSKRFSIEMHWMTNLNAKNVRKALANLQSYIPDFKFINNCADHTLDICAFLTKHDYVKCLDIKSDGPITFKENSSHHHKFFPHLKILKLHLGERNAIDFLEKLDRIFCERVEELWLYTNDSGCQVLERKHAHEMTNILTKFKNLTSLNLAPAFAHFDPKHVLSECQNLKDLHIRR